MQLNSISFIAENATLSLEVDGIPAVFASVIRSPILIKASPSVIDVFNEPSALRDAEHVLFDNEREVWLISRGGKSSEVTPEYVRAGAPDDWPDRFRAVISDSFENALRPNKAKRKGRGN